MFGVSADFIHPTAMAEGGLHASTLTTAAPHFTFLQYAAHVPNGDFVRYFRTLLALPLASSTSRISSLILDVFAVSPMTESHHWKPTFPPKP